MTQVIGRIKNGCTAAGGQNKTKSPCGEKAKNCDLVVNGVSRMSPSGL